MHGNEQVTVTVWTLAVSPQRLARFRSILSPEEGARADRLRNEAVVRDFVAGRGMLREILAHEFGCRPDEIGIADGPRGKPFLDRPNSAPAFNLSHSGGYCAVALGAFEALGVDIEAIRPTISDLAPNVFTPDERTAYESLAGHDRIPAFFRAWVAKEAYLKATGEGLAGGLQSLEVKLTTSAHIQPVSIRQDANALADWHFHGFDVSAGIFGAVAARAKRPTVALRVRHIDPERPPWR